LPVATTSPRRWFCNESPHFCVAGAALAKAVFLTVARHAGYPPCNPLPHGNNNGNGNGQPGLEVLYLLALSDYALSLKRLAVWEKHVLSAGMAAGARARARLPGRRPAPVPALTPHAAAAVARVLPLLQVTCLRFVFVRFSRCPHRVLCCVFSPRQNELARHLGNPGPQAAALKELKDVVRLSHPSSNLPYSVSPLIFLSCQALPLQAVGPHPLQRADYTPGQLPPTATAAEDGEP
jgi:hypothetical protein